LAFNEELSVGRVQTATLAMLVEREIAIRNFVVEEYLEVHATFASGSQKKSIAVCGSAQSRRKRVCRLTGWRHRRSSSGHLRARRRPNPSIPPPSARPRLFRTT